MCVCVCVCVCECRRAGVHVHGELGSGTLWYTHIHEVNHATGYAGLHCVADIKASGSPRFWDFIGHCNCQCS